MEEPAIPPILTVLVFLWTLAFGVAAAWTAAELGRARPLWFAFGVILGPVALVILRAAPPALCRTCGSPTRGWLKACWWCRRSVFGPPRETERPVRVAGEVLVNQASPHPELARPSKPQRSLRDRLGPPPDPTGTLATAVYVAGSTNLQSGSRYGIAIRESRLQILGPTEVRPERVALDHSLAGLDARSVEGRLILADSNGFVLAFMAVAGPSTRDLAARIMDAARGGDQP